MEQHRHGLHGMQADVEDLVPATFEVVVGTQRTRVEQVTRAFRLDPASRADVVQTCWLRLAEHWSEVRDPGPWLRTTARNECLRLLRARSRERPAPDDALERHDCERPVEELIEHRDEIATVTAAVERLGARDQQLLRAVGAGWTYARIASTFDMPLGSIAPSRQRSLKRLRRELGYETRQRRSPSRTIRRTSTGSTAGRSGK